MLARITPITPYAKGRDLSNESQISRITDGLIRDRRSTEVNAALCLTEIRGRYSGSDGHSHSESKSPTELHINAPGRLR